MALHCSLRAENGNTTFGQDKWGDDRITVGGSDQVKLATL